MECPELQQLLDQIEGNVIPLRMKAEIESLLENNNTCRAGYARFLQIEQILQNTVYGEMDKDKHLAYLSHLAGRNLRYQREDEKLAEAKNPFKLSLAKMIGFILVAAAVGTSAALVAALMNRNKPPVVVELSDSLAKEVRVISSDQVKRIPIPGTVEQSSTCLSRKAMAQLILPLFWISSTAPLTMKLSRKVHSRTVPG